MNLDARARRCAASALAMSLAAASVLAPSGPAVAHPHVWVSVETTVVVENGAVTSLRQRWLFDEFYSAGAVEGLDTNKDGRVDRSELAEVTKINIEGLKEFDYFTHARLGQMQLDFKDPLDAFMELVEMEDAPGPQTMAGAGSSAPAGEPSPAPGQQPPASGGLWSRITGAIAGWWSGLVKPPATPGGSSTAVAKPKVLTLEFTLPLIKPVLVEAPDFVFTVQDPSIFIWFEFAPKDPVRISSGAPPNCKAVLADPQMDEQQRRLNEAFGQSGMMSSGMVGQGKMVKLECGKS